MAKIQENERAAAALASTKSNRLAVSGSNTPDFDKLNADKVKAGE